MKWRRNLFTRFALNSFVSGDFPRAEKYFRLLKEREPDRMGVDHNLGLTKLAQKQYAEAERYFKRDMELFGQTAVRSRTLGDLYYVWGKRKEARKWYASALEDADDEASTVLLRERIEICATDESFEPIHGSYAAFEEGVRLQRSGDAEGARLALQKAVDLDSTNFQAWNNLGSILMDNDANFSEALVCFRKAREYSSIPAIVNNIEQAEARSDRSTHGT